MGRATLVQSISRSAVMSSDDWDIAVEVAGQHAVRQHALRCLELGRTFLMTSVGSLTDEALHSELKAAASKHNTQLLLCSGSMPGLDMGPAALVGATKVAVTQSKPPKAWIGTPAESQFDVLSLMEPTVLFLRPLRGRRHPCIPRTATSWQPWPSLQRVWMRSRSSSRPTQARPTTQHRWNSKARQGN